ncbi:MAG: hypothetical protein M5U16_04230 [Hyphomicrobium sp.]|nr:hypothetical protein [Hyphomicrobium sp.]
MAMLAGLGAMSMIVVLGPRLVVVDVALGIMVEFDELALMPQDLGYGICSRLSEHPQSLEYLIAGARHAFEIRCGEAFKIGRISRFELGCAWHEISRDGGNGFRALAIRAGLARGYTAPQSLWAAPSLMKPFSGARRSRT